MLGDVFSTRGKGESHKQEEEKSILHNAYLDN